MIKQLAICAALLLSATASASAQKLQPGEVRLTIGSWKGTAEIDAFTRKEKLILTSSKSLFTGLVLRCMDGELSVGWLDLGGGGAFSPGDSGELMLRVGDDVIGPIELTAMNKGFAAGNLTHEQLSRLAKANKEIGYKAMIEGRGGTGGVGAIKTADVAARLRKSCTGQETISPANKEKITPRGEGQIEEKAD